MSSIGQAVVAVVGGAVGAYFGNPMLGLSLGLALGGVLFPPTTNNPLPKPASLNIQTSQMGLAIPVIYGARRVAGNLIWYGNFTPWAHEEGSSGKMGGGSSFTSYTYSVGMCWGICMSPPGRRKTVINVWAGKDKISADKYWVFDGSQTEPDYNFQINTPDRPPVWKNLLYVLMPGYDLGSNLFLPAFTFEVADSETAEDVLPTSIMRDVLTNDLYGLGLSEDYLNAEVEAVTAAYCTAQGLKMSALFNYQISLLDVLGYIIQHHNGFVTYYNGKISHDQMQYTTPTDTISAANNDFDMDQQFPVQIQKSGEKEYNNKVTVEYSRRAADYVIGTTIADDIVDIDNFRLRDLVLNLDSICTFEIADKMCWQILRKSLLRPRNLQFQTGPKSRAKLLPGKIVYLTDPQTELTNLPVRVVTVGEEAGCKIKVSAIEENPYIYDFSLAPNRDEPPLPPELPDPTEPPDVAQRTIGFVIDEEYTGGARKVAVICTKPDDSFSWAGASIYRSYTAGGSYTKLMSNTGSGVAGMVVEAADDEGIAYITVELDTDATLSSISQEEMDADLLKNLFYVVGKGYCKFKTVELLSDRVWKLTDLLWGLPSDQTSNSYGTTVGTDVVAFFQGTVNIIDLQPTEVDITLYIKAVPFSLVGEELSLADVGYITVDV